MRAGLAIKQEAEEWLRAGHPGGSLRLCCPSLGRELHVQSLTPGALYSVLESVFSPPLSIEQQDVIVITEPAAPTKTDQMEASVIHMHEAGGCQPITLTLAVGL
ncbi:hypothetical protein EYF80_030194 [Liparis tanakae]|uniref:Uncharacterized protein n=1 Tax=Liparis tanakae TaxID=230148 RepID=A0A4Z2H407_9TELE|nr:hypothetical protein EYF80_030194 [Liparis tanakae]